MSFAAHLVHPDLFPARLSGEPWGGQELGLVVAGEAYRIGGLAETQADALRRRFAAFVVDAAQAGGVELCLYRVAAAEFLPLDMRGRELTLELEPGERSLRVAGLDLLALVEWRDAPTAGLWTPHAGDGCVGACENLLRLLAAYRLLARGGLLLHSAGVVDGGRGHLFLGQSGAGKSTLCGLSNAEARSVLSDDLNAVLSGPEGHVLLGVPFAGDLRADGPRPPAPLAALYTLSKQSRHARTALPRAALLAAAVGCAPYVNRDPFRLGALVQAAGALVDSVPGFRLEFSRDGGLWRTLSR
jgi:hypothetical protein